METGGVCSLASEAEKRSLLKWRGPKEVCGLARFALNLDPSEMLHSFCIISPSSIPSGVCGRIQQVSTGSLAISALQSYGGLDALVQSLRVQERVTRLNHQLSRSRVANTNERSARVLHPRWLFASSDLKNPGRAGNRAAAVQPEAWSALS